MQGITVRHRSPSVANNYAIHSQAGSCELRACDISSASGSGIGVEGGRLLATAVRVHDCVSNGLVAAADVTEGEPADVSLIGCTLVRNGRSGAVLLDGTTALLRDCTVEGNVKGLELRVRPHEGPAAEGSLRERQRGPAAAEALLRDCSCCPAPVPRPLA